ncbi:MAG TPA: glycosyltransferase [bacterium]|nr:glycosyltransferase [bacterium]
MKQIKVLLLADSSSIHTRRWANALNESGLNVFIFSLCDPTGKYNDGIKIYSQGFNPNWTNRDTKVYNKIIYLKTLFALKKIIKKVKPNIVHAHFATSYGLLGALSGFQPYIISVWGSDVYDFPKRSFINKLILKFNLSKANIILSTSHVMAKETSQYTKKPIIVTPFGVDIEKFKLTSENKINSKLIFGTIKTLDPKYGIDILIQAFALVYKRLKDENVESELHIIGGGPSEFELKKLVESLNLKDYVRFVGKVTHDCVPKYLNSFDVFVALSIDNSESFGVAVVEASSCSLPVVVTSVGGLPEIVSDNFTGYIVPPNDPVTAADKMFDLSMNFEKRKYFGKNGRLLVEEKFNWNDNVNRMLEIYNFILKM